ncbi:hypothetical protein KEM48_002603 [Puccinia striiformis f. sp. tritici PST-130]|nr:hypothetical protein KEM48_002603 [Puccinia striiformis f. sp. tritici PST-130]
MRLSSGNLNMSSTLCSFGFITVYFLGLSQAASSSSLVSQYVTGFATTATPSTRPAIDIIGIGPQRVAQSPHAEFISPDYATWPPLDAPAWAPNDNSNSFYSFKTVPKEKKMPSLNPDDISASHDRNGTVQSLPKGQFVGPDYCLHDQIVPSASPKNQSPSPEAGHNQKLLANAPEDLTAFPQIFRRPGLSSVYAFPAHTSPSNTFRPRAAQNIQEVA